MQDTRHSPGMRCQRVDALMANWKPFPQFGAALAKPAITPIGQRFTFLSTLTGDQCSDVVQGTPLVSRPFHGGKTSMAWLFLAAFLGVMGTLAVVGAFVAMQRYQERRAKNTASRSTWPPRS